MGRTLNPPAQAHRKFESCLVLLCACTPMAEGTRRERVQCSFESSQAHQISSVAATVLGLLTRDRVALLCIG